MRNYGLDEKSSLLAGFPRHLCVNLKQSSKREKWKHTTPPIKLQSSPNALTCFVKYVLNICLAGEYRKRRRIQPTIQMNELKHRFSLLQTRVVFVSIGQQIPPSCIQTRETAAQTNSA
ncbi:unnamed protein product [Arctogadus glacialis]